MRTQPSRIDFARAAVATVVVAALAFAQTPAQAQNQPPQTNGGAVPAVIPPGSLLKVSPPVIQAPGPNDKAVTTTVAVLERNCDAAGKPTVDLSNTVLVSTGVGLLAPPDGQRSSSCAIQATLTVNPGTLPGSYSLLVDDTTKAPVGEAAISIVGSTAGPIPPGIAPSTDVIWGVMTYNNCSDAFGRRVAGSFYCIQLKIGNNSGYGLQVAGVGFAKSLKALDALDIPGVTVANTSYGATRAVLVHSQQISWRNFTYDFLVGAGLIMAASTPFFFNAGTSALRAKTRFSTISTIINGPLQQAFNLLIPDPVVTQLQNLDNQSFRDNMVIPNNSQIQTVVFVEKQAVTPALNELRLAMAQQRSKQTGIALDSLNNLDGIVKDSATNSGRPKVSFAAGNPVMIKLALGDLVIVGDHIQYLDRVQIQSNPTTASSASKPEAPTIGTVTPGNGQAVVSFTPPTNNGGASITTYTVTASPGGITATGTSSPITVTGLTNGTPYTFTVSATNSAGTGPASAPSSSVTPQ